MELVHGSTSPLLGGLPSPMTPSAFYAADPAPRLTPPPPMGGWASTGVAWHPPGRLTQLFKRTEGGLGGFTDAFSPPPARRV